MMKKARIVKKLHGRYLAEFLLECSQDEEWKKKLQSLNEENRLETAVEGLPPAFIEDFPETTEMSLEYSVERLSLEEVPRAASCWWPVDEQTHFYVAYPAQFPEKRLYMAVDFDDHSDCCA